MRQTHIYEMLFMWFETTSIDIRGKQRARTRQEDIELTIYIDYIDYEKRSQQFVCIDIHLPILSLTPSNRKEKAIIL